MTAEQKYASVSLFVDGALDTEEDVRWDQVEDLVAEWKDATVQEGRAMNRRIECAVFIVPHEHERIKIGDCECVQYLTDHKPTHQWVVTGP